jgi:hypothetical protein
MSQANFVSKSVSPKEQIPANKIKNIFSQYDYDDAVHNNFFIAVHSKVYYHIMILTDTVIRSISVNYMCGPLGNIKYQPKLLPL